jgi:hypothetical protein
MNCHNKIFYLHKSCFICRGFPTVSTEAETHHQKSTTTFERRKKEEKEEDEGDDKIQNI